MELPFVRDEKTNKKQNTDLNEMNTGQWLEEVIQQTHGGRTVFRLDTRQPPAAAVV